ncbi:MAG: hypothetical protein SFU85_05265 [Candidatus Methylacidiphilales bacterium]|nr:hypothetical protein [Candidatus Methylacidiphilales bacterium]
MTPILWTYTAYVTLSLALTIWVARTLHKGGRVFLVDVFGGNTELADSTNHLLVVGFYLINLGYIALNLRYAFEIDTTRAGVEVLSGKVGGVLVALGLLHFFNLFVFSRIRRRALRAGCEAPPPIPAQGLVQTNLETFNP